LPGRRIATGLDNCEKTTQRPCGPSDAFQRALGLKTFNGPIHPMGKTFDILDLLEVLIGSAHLEQIAVIYLKVSFSRVVDFAHTAQLIEK
jgi:hypothetical protein